MQLRKATRQKAKIRLGLSAVSGGGKTYSAILIAKGLAGGDLSKVAIIDTENNSADLYAHLGDYSVLPLSAPYSPERYSEAIKACEAAGMAVIIIDSITHEWDGSGGIIDISNNMPGNSFTNWAKITPRHQAFINTILQSPCHVLATVRRKQDYELSKDSSGKTTVQKVGMKEVTREGWEYELTANLEIDTNHHAVSSKDRTGLFMGKPAFIPSEETGAMILQWCESGVDMAAEVDKAIADLLDIDNADTLKIMAEDLPEYVRMDTRFRNAASVRLKEFKPARTREESEVAAAISALNNCKTEADLDAFAATQPKHVRDNEQFVAACANHRKSITPQTVPA